MLKYEDDNFDAIFRNDINDRFVNLDRIKFFRMHPTRWHSGKVPFIKSFNNCTLSDQLKKALYAFLRTKNVRFIEYNKDKDRDYINFIQQIGDEIIFPKLGRHPGENKIYLMQNDSAKRITHLMMHALGFLDEMVHEGINRNYVCERASDGLSLSALLAPSIGPYDRDSIMLEYQCYSIGTISIVSVPKSANFTGLVKSDIEKVNFFYGSNLCSFDGYKSSGTNTKYYQPYYTCKTCWGNKNEFYICVFCADMHHFEHDKVYTNLQVAISKKIQIVCNCAKDKHKIGCTKIITNEIQVLQPVYKCQTCHELNKRKITETMLSMFH